ncbi:MAG: hypothetical protein PHN84_04110 [Desulfuromonadaceae bacterium]|nr:hypothetical protein [Desulfuromonadaceae bacterium]MDD2855296.1 hypothetical protein [Desulfuromonadaceae bacterium]
MFEMKRLFVLGAAVILLSVASVFAAVIIQNATDLRTFVDTTIGQNLSTLSQTANVNGQTVVWWQEPPQTGPNGTIPGQIAIDIGGVASFYNTLDEVYLALAEHFNISLTSVASISNPSSPSVMTTNTVFSNLVLPPPKTASEKTAVQPKDKDGRDIRESNRLRTFGASLSTEFVDKNNDYKGQVYGMNLGLAYDLDDFTVGVILPYQHFDYNILDADRIGTIFFGQYIVPLGDELSVAFTGNMNYLYNYLSYNKGGHDKRNMFGAGLSSGLQYNSDLLELGVGATYQYNKDNSNQADDYQLLVKTGANAGVRIGNNQVASVNIAYTGDVTNYKAKPEDQNYYEVGGEYRVNVSETWGLNLGYKKTLGLYKYRSDLVYLGSAVHF